MRKFLSGVLMAALAASVPVQASGSEGGPVTLTGTAYRTNLQPLSGVEVQVRSLRTGSLVGSTTSTANGEFYFKDIQPGSYVVEIVNASGRLLGMSPPLTLGSASTVKVSVVAVAEGAAAASGGAGFSLLGLGPVTSLAVVGAASAAAVSAVVATRPDASPSR